LSNDADFSVSLNRFVGVPYQIDKRLLYLYAVDFQKNGEF